ncbi:hypothetical protein ACQQ2N_14180 [Dokdonella sp. MW10]|uniref:hypothetical protein n=1 Tax=Dokdonella sp. MW10 TaxID=2992926 RepID=UPI003F7D4E0E
MNTRIDTLLRRHACLAAVLAASVLAGGASTHATAQSLDELQFKVSVETPADFRAEADRIRASMGEGGRHAGIASREKGRVEALLITMQSLFDARGGGGAFNETDRIAAMNAQEEINAILLRNDGDRIVCEFVTQTGSHRRSKICMTAAQREQQRRENQSALGEHVRSRDVGSGY